MLVSTPCFATLNSLALRYNQRSLQLLDQQKLPQEEVQRGNSYIMYFVISP
jgi:hypothetical protein